MGTHSSYQLGSVSRWSFHKAILATIDLSYLQNNFKTIVNPAHVENCFMVHTTE